MASSDQWIVDEWRSADVAGLYEKYGGLMLRQALDEREMDLIEHAFEWRIANPGPNATRMYPGADFLIFQETANSWAEPNFAPVLDDTQAPDIVSKIFRTGPVWFMGEQLWMKEGAARRTPWHQDGASVPFEGKKTLTMWIALDDLPQEAVLELVLGSHRGPIYSLTGFDPDDDTEPMYHHPDFPRIPDIEAQREKWDIAGTSTKRGDILVFHTDTLHGGAVTWPGLKRRTLSLRFFGDDAVRKFIPENTSELYQETQAPEAEDQVLTTRFMKVPLGEPLHTAKGVPQVRP